MDREAHNECAHDDAIEIAQSGGKILISGTKQGDENSAMCVVHWEDDDVSVHIMITPYTDLACALREALTCWEKRDALKFKRNGDDHGTH